MATATYVDVYTGRPLSLEETAEVERRFPEFDAGTKQPNQYRPPTQQDDWKPEAPLAGQRVNPLTGESEPRVFPKSYGCDGGFDYGLMYTMRSGTAAFYDKRLDSGTIHISGPRSGCTNSIVPACGLLNLPYYYQGCTCSYPLPTAASLVSMPASYEQWSVWGLADAKPVRGIQRVGINFGAPGDRMTEAGTLWLDTPSVGGPSPTVAVSWDDESSETFYRHSLFIRGGSGWPWVGASGIEGLSRVAINDLKPGQYTVRLYFAEPHSLAEGERRFDVSLQGETALEDFDVVQAAGGAMRVEVKQHDNVPSDGNLEIHTTPRAGKPLLCGIEVVAAGLPLDEIVPLEDP